MKLLLDTHALLWWLDNPALLSEEATEAIRNGENTVHISAAVIWEMVIKKSLGKLEIPDNIEETLAANHFHLLPISVDHVLAVQALPQYHRDPFDRVLVAQSIREGLTLVTRDPKVLRYQVSHLVA